MLDALWATSHSPTGKARGTLPFGLLEKADLATEMVEQKHYFRNGVSAREGVEI